MTSTVSSVKICYALRMRASVQKDTPLYVTLAEHLTRQVAQGVLRQGDRVLLFCAT